MKQFFFFIWKENKIATLLGLVHSIGFGGGGKVNQRGRATIEAKWILVSMLNENSLSKLPI